MKRSTAICLALLGPALVALGVALIKTGTMPAALTALPYLCVGVGCGAFGHGAGELLRLRALKSDPQLARQFEIEQKDERNQALSNMAKAKAYDQMVFVFGALQLAFALMQVPLAPLLLLVAAYLFVVFTGVYYRCKFDKQL